MPTQPTYDDVNLILRLYELRREEKLRKARAWFVASFKFKTIEEFEAACPMGSEENSYARMVGTYWEMVASFINSGVLEKVLFYKSGGELLFVYLRVLDLLEPMRTAFKDPTMYGELEEAAKAMIEWRKSRSAEGFEVFRKRVRGE